MHNDNLPNSAPQPRWRWRQTRWWWGLGLLLVLVASAPGLYFFLNLLEDWKLQAFLAELDRTAPGWRIEDIEKARAPIPDKENSALVVMTLGKDPFRGWDLELLQLPEGPPPELLNPEHDKALREALKPLAPALVRLRQLRHMGTGRFPIHWAEDGITTSHDSQFKIWPAGKLLAFDALLRTQDKDYQGAWDCAHAIYNTARSLGDEPRLTTYLMGLGLRDIAIANMETILAHGRLSSESLADVQRALDGEAKNSSLLPVARGERALLHRLLVAVETGKIEPKVLVAFGYRRPEPNTLGGKILSQLPERTVPRCHIETLRLMNQLLEVIKQPGSEQRPGLEKWAELCAQSSDLTKALVSPWKQIVRSERRNRALIRCAVGGLAVERYRLKHGQWPNSLKAVVAAGFLQEEPLDPFDGHVLRYRPTKDGVVIFSIGPDGTGKGDFWDKQEPDSLGQRFEFRLWNVACRRQPAIRRPRAEPFPGEAPEGDLAPALAPLRPGGLPHL